MAGGCGRDGHEDSGRAGVVVPVGGEMRGAGIRLPFLIVVRRRGTVPTTPTPTPTQVPPVLPDAPFMPGLLGGDGYASTPIPIAILIPLMLTTSTVQPLVRRDAIGRPKHPWHTPTPKMRLSTFRVLRPLHPSTVDRSVILP